MGALCVDLPGGDTSNGALLELWECYGGDSQMWGYNSDAGTIYLASTTTPKCVAKGGSNSGDPLMIWDCKPDTSQVWSVGATPGPGPVPAPAPTVDPASGPAPAPTALHIDSTWFV